jgi:hypothetical protein
MANRITYFKQSYYALMDAPGPNRVPVIRFLPWNFSRPADELALTLEAGGWTGDIILKPEYSALSKFIIFADARKLIARDSEELARLNAHFRDMHGQGLASCAVQSVVPGFADHWELRTYWGNREYLYTIGSRLSRAAIEHASFTGSLQIQTALYAEETSGRGQGGVLLPTDGQAEVRELAQRALARMATLPDVYGLDFPHIRFDFGCCSPSVIEGRQYKYFLNEVEFLGFKFLEDFPAAQAHALLERMATAWVASAHQARDAGRPWKRPADYKLPPNPEEEAEGTPEALKLQGCQPFCIAEPCHALNGNVLKECGGCVPHSSRCAPGQPGFPKDEL